MDYAICCALFASLYQGDKCKNFNILYFNSKPILKAITEKFDVKKAEKGFEKITIKFSLVELIIITRVCLDINFANLSGLNKSGVVKLEYFADNLKSYFVDVFKNNEKVILIITDYFFLLNENDKYEKLTKFQIILNPLDSALLGSYVLAKLKGDTTYENTLSPIAYNLIGSLALELIEKSESNLPEPDESILNNDAVKLFNKNLGNLLK